MLPPKSRISAFTIVATICHASVALAANQTATLSPVLSGEGLPYRISLERYDFGADPLPTLQSNAAGYYDGKWVLIAGRTNGLHGFGAIAANNFPPQYQNREVWVVDPVAKQSWHRSFDDASAGLSEEEIRSLTQANNEFYQRGNRLYMAGGYGLQEVLPDDTPVNNTFDTLSAIDLPGIVDWVVGGTGAAADHIRQISDPLFRVTGGDMFEISGRTHLVFGQDFQGNYVPGSNGIYTEQVRSFDIVDDGATLVIENVSSTVPDPNYRRRDLNVVPVIRQGTGGQLEEGLTALSGVFTSTNGAWTVPVEIDADGHPTMADPDDPDTFKQGMSGYHSAKLGLYSESLGEMHEVLFGGISLQFLDSDTGQIETDSRFPFVNDVTSIVVDSAGEYSQHRIGEFPVLTDQQGNRLRFGANAEFFLADGVEEYDNGVIILDALTAPTTLGYVFGGLAANGPHARNVPGVTSLASNTIFRVVLVPVPEPGAGLLGIVGMLGVCGMASRPGRHRREHGNLE